MEQQTVQKNTHSLDDVQEIDLIDLFGYYMSRLWLLIAAVVIGAVIAGAYTFYLVPNRFTAVSRMYMISASSSSVVDLSDLNIGASLSNDYVELMKSRPIIEDVINELGLGYTYEQVLNMIRLDVVTNTRIIKISATSTDPEEAMNIANQMARIAKIRLPKIMDAPSPSIAEEAVLPTQKSSPSLSRNVMMGSMVLLFLVLAILTIQYLLDDTVQTSEDVEKEFGILPMTVIPEGTIEGLKKVSDTTRRSGRFNKKKKEGEKAS